MDREQSIFIKILSDHLNHRPTDAFNDLDWSVISDLAHIHNVEGIVYFQCKGLMPENIRSKHEQAFYSTLYDFSNRRQLMKNVAHSLVDEGLTFIAVKGLEVAKYYPHPELRTMGDCDLIVHRKDFAHTIRVLEKLGFAGSSITSVQQWGCDFQNYHFEVHDRLVQEGEYATIRQVAFFNDYDRYVNNNSLDVSFHFLYLFMHLRKHFLNHGVGIRQFMDLAVMIREEHELNWNWIQAQLQKLDLQIFAEVCYALIDRWFYIEVPVDYAILSEEDLDQITVKILKNGVFGFHDLDNRKANAYTALLKARGPLFIRRCSILFKSIFLSYEIMRGYEGCGFVDGRPWLMPIAWGKRLVSIISRNNKTNTVNVIKNSLTNKSSLDERQRLLKKMGLL